MTQNYYYKHEVQSGHVYIHCKWLNDVSLEADSTQRICEISLSDTTAFWHTRVTMADILCFRSLHIDVDLWKQLIQAALVGNSEFRGEPLERRLTFSKDKCTISWVSRLEGSIDLQIAEVTLEQSQDKDTPNQWKSLLNSLFDDEMSLKESRNAMMTRIKGLEETCEQLKHAAERIVRDKLDAELLLMDKFKLILNAKKRKIKNLTTALQNADLLQSNEPPIAESSNSPAVGSTPVSISNTQTGMTRRDKGKRKRTQSHDIIGEGSSLSQAGSQPTPKRKPTTRKRSPSATPSLEELIIDSPFKSKVKMEPSDKADTPLRSFHVSNESYHFNPSPSIKPASPSPQKLPAVQEEEIASSAQAGHVDNFSFLLDDDDLAVRTRTVRTSRRKKR
ncbi:hypothetical protein BC943DRAFT_329483 [Umbelopsis sp. AD052]|nr:hypothetical protein BC943DRAFT_329483 [Umbelopsis sp. AD052]